MITNLYMDNHTIIHRLSPMLKIIGLIIITTLLLIFDTWFMLGSVIFGTLLLYMLAKISIPIMIKQLRFALPMLVFFLIFQLIIHDLWQAFFIIIRLVVILLLGNLLTLTTKTSKLMDSIEYHLRHLTMVGLNPAKISLTFSLCLRFIPVLAMTTKEVMEAQKARGMHKNMIALIVPIIIRSLKMADDIADAIEARSYNP